MSAGGHAARLHALTQDLLQRWRQTREVWRDAKAREFEERYLRELEAVVTAAGHGMEQLEHVLRKIRHDCE
ncbi:MAG: hypothetical protein ACO34E_09755 [Limisphaerales bacterium]